MCPGDPLEHGASKNKHIQALHHFVRKQIQSKVITCYLPCRDQIEMVFPGFLPVFFSQMHYNKRFHTSRRKALKNIL
jgi:hypothetical protein